MNANTIANYVGFIFKIQPRLTTSQLCHWHPRSSQLLPWPGLIQRPAFCFPCRLALQPFLPSAKSLQSCPTLCDPIDGSPPGSPVPGILQARVLEWGAIAFSVSAL